MVEYLAHAKIPTVTANLNRTSEPRLNHTNVKDSVVLNMAGVKIGVVGYLTPETMVLGLNRSTKLHMQRALFSIVLINFTPNRKLLAQKIFIYLKKFQAFEMKLDD